MNIFYLDESPIVSAHCMVDKHVVKMILETAQLLSTAHNILDRFPDQRYYKTTHLNHPCSIWTRQSRMHYNWLFKHWLALNDEYTYRYGKIHKCWSLKNLLENIPDLMKDLPYRWIDPPQCMPDEFKNENTVEAYRKYYAIGKKHLHKWKGRKPPIWLINHVTVEKSI